MEELISVVISTYKRDEVLIRAIKSVLNQTYKNFEIIVVDDNGRNTIHQKKVEKIMKQYKDCINIKYIVNEINMGGAISRNIGIDNSNGNYIAFLDDDDEYYCEKLEKQISLLRKKENKNVALVYCYTESYDENNKKIREYKNDFMGKCLFNAMYDCIAATSQWMVKKECIEDVDKFSNVPSKQDSTLMIKLINNGYEIDRVPEILVKYNEHSQERISSGGIKNINGEKLLRNYCRTLYNKLTSSEIIKVEASFSYRLSKLYLKNKLFNELSEEIQTLFLVNKIKFIKILFYRWKEHLLIGNKR